MASQLIAAAVLAVSPISVAEASGIDLPQFEEEPPQIVEGETDPFDRMTVPVMIDGQGPFAFMIDTGAQATAVSRDLKERLALKSSGSAVVVGMASRASVELVEVNRLEFAARVVDRLRAPLLEARHIGADGILGIDTLQDMRVVIDFREGTVAVNDAASLGKARGYEIVVRARRQLGRLIITEADIDGVRTSVIIDTGAQSSIGNLSLRNRLRAKRRETLESKDVHGKSLVGHVDFARSLKIDRMRLDNLAIMFADGPAFAQLGLDRRPAMILGMRSLRAFDRVAIDFDSREILFDMPR